LKRLLNLLVGVVVDEGRRRLVVARGRCDFVRLPWKSIAK